MSGKTSVLLGSVWMAAFNVPIYTTQMRANCRYNQTGYRELKRNSISLFVDYDNLTNYLDTRIRYTCI